MFKDQCISVTELRTNTKKCLEDLEKLPKYIFVNNHPIAVLVDIAEYEDRLFKPSLTELRSRDVTPNLAAQAKKARTAKKSELINLR